MEIIGEVKNVSESKSGKSLRVLVGETWLGASKKSGLDSQRGNVLKVTYSDGDFGPWVDEWTHSDHAPQPVANLATPAGTKDRSIIMQSIAKAVIEADAKLIAAGKPPMDEEYIRARVHFLYDLAAEVLAWG